MGERENLSAKTGDAGCLKRMALLGGALAILCFGGFLLHSHYRLQKLRAQNAKILANLKREGYATSLEELENAYAYPVGINGADLWEAAFRLVPDYDQVPADLPELGTTNWPPLDKPCTPQQLTLIDTFLSSHPDLLDAIDHAAAANVPSRYPIKLQDGPICELPHLNGLRRTEMVLRLRIYSLADIGKDDAAQKIALEFEKVHALADSLHAEPFHVCTIYENRLRGGILTTLQKIVFVYPDLWRQLVQCVSVKAYLHREDAQCKRNIVADLLCLNETYERILTNNLWPDFYAMANVEPPTILDRFRMSMSRMDWEEDRNLTLSVCRDAMELSGSSYPMQKAWITKMKGTLTPASGTFGAELVSSTFLSNGFDGFKTYTLACAQWRVLHAAMAVERYRTAKGELPATLDALVPEFLDAVPDDPFDGKPLRYKQTTPGFVVYSVGDDLKDDGGTDAAFPKQMSFVPDVIFVVPY